MQKRLCSQSKSRQIHKTDKLGNEVLPSEPKPPPADDFCIILGFEPMISGVIMVECLVVGVGGFIGSVLRYLIGLIPLKLTSGLPIKTLFINVVGSFFIGLITALFIKKSTISPQMLLFLKVGICGGFTTYSTFAIESVDLIKSGNIGMAILYVVCSVVFGVLAIYLSQIIVK